MGKIRVNEFHFVRGSLLALASMLVTAGSTSSEAKYVVSVDCEVGQVAVLENRAHVFCDQQYQSGTTRPISPQVYRYFAVPTSVTLDRLAADRLIRMASSSPSGKIRIWFDVDDTSAASYGCLARDCRRPLSISSIQ